MTTPTLAQTLARQFAAAAGPTIVANIKALHRIATAVLLASFAVNYEHQLHALDAAGLGLAAIVLIPLLLDGTTVAMVKSLATPCVARAGRIFAAATLAFTVTASTLINYFGPGTATVQAIYSAVVILIGLSELVRATTKVDFAALDRLERQAGADIPEQAVDVDAQQEAIRAAAAELVAKELKRQADNAKARARRAAAKGPKAPAAAHPVAEIEGLDDVAPISPAAYLADSYYGGPAI